MTFLSLGPLKDPYAMEHDSINELAWDQIGWGM